MIKRIFISTGEPSGDLHAANFVRAFNRRSPGTEFVGFGGPKLEEAGAEVLYPLVELAVMWFGRVLLNLHKFIHLLNQAEKYFREHRPDALVVIDYPGFHWALARRAKRHGIPVYYYVPPQIWAWAGWRVKKVQKYVDLALCSLPFEPEWYRARGFQNAGFVGHPYFDELAERRLDRDFLDHESGKPGALVVLLPGSRTQEITKNLPMMLAAAAKLYRVRPSTRFVVSCLHERHHILALELLQKADPSVPIEVHPGRTPELIRLAKVAWAVSGSVSLELMAEALPTVVVYKIRRFDLWVAKRFIKSRYITLVNLLANEELFPEYLTAVDVSDQMAEWALRWLNVPGERELASGRLRELRDRVAVPGASERAAQAVLESLEKGSWSPPSPHVVGGGMVEENVAIHQS